MAIQADRNLYPGINIHLNNLLQNEPGGWASFHAGHIVHLREALDAQLPAGYFTRSEKSLQDSLDDEAMLTGQVIYEVGESITLSTPITWLELLTPENKPAGPHSEKYMVKRRETFESGLCLVEVDYLRQTPPITRALPSYPARAERAYLFAILVSDPRPTWEQGKMDVYCFDVDQALPVIDIPLAGADTVRLDFGAVYNHTFASARFYRMVVDYEQEPVALDTFSAADQERIRRMLSDIRRDASAGG